MAHELDFKENGEAAMAYIGKDKPWHGLGQELALDADIDVWKVQAGFDWDIASSPVMFKAGDATHNFNGKQVLHRSDNGNPLSIVSSEYKVVQPKEILEFFRELVGEAGMQLSTAGVLFGGKKFWALADTGKFGVLNGNDKIKGNLLLSTSCDGSTSTVASFVATRVVCNNTLRIALQENAKSQIRVHHSREFDANLVKQNLGLINTNWDKFMANIQDMSKFNISQEKAELFVYDLMKRTNLEDDDQPKTLEKNIANVMGRFNNGMGNNGKTLWDLLNGVTEYYTHDMGRTRAIDTKFWNNMYGWQSDKKEQAFLNAVELMNA